MYNPNNRVVSTFIDWNVVSISRDRASKISTESSRAYYTYVRGEKSCSRLGWETWITADGLFVERSVAISVNIHATNVKSVDLLAIANFVRDKRYFNFRMIG